MNTCRLLCSVLRSSLAGANNSLYSAYVTFYGAKDNCPPGGMIAFPSLHTSAGGTGTFADPITFAGAPLALPPGTRIYVPEVKRYFIMEDECYSCVQDWSRGTVHVDLWIGPTVATSGSPLIDCEVALSGVVASGNSSIIVAPVSTYPVNTSALFDGSTQSCAVPATQCVDQGSACGNACVLPDAYNCSGLAALFSLTVPRLQALNPSLGCGGTVAAGTRESCYPAVAPLLLNDVHPAA